MKPYLREFQQEVTNPKFDTKHANTLQEFEWLLVQYHTTGSVPIPPTWTSTCNSTGFLNMQRRLFGEANYQFYIGTFQGLLGFHQINDPAKYPSTKGFPTTKTSTGVLLQPPHVLTERMRAPLVHGSNKSSDPHQCIGHL
jgi:hypothetical protein